MIEIGPAITLTAHGASDVGRSRSSNEDAFLVAALQSNAATTETPSTLEVSTCPALLAVADGVGGQNAGEVASKLTLKSLRSTLLAESERYCLADALRVCVELAHEEVKGAGAAEGHRNGMGSTLVASVIAGTTGYVASVGDSRLYLYRDGGLEQVTKDHTLYQHALDNGATLLDEASARHVLLQVIGQPRPLSFEVQRIPLHSGDIVLLCSDGLSGSVSDAEIAQTLTRPSRLDVVAEELIALANSHGGHDNITVVLARVEKAETSAASHSG